MKIRSTLMAVTLGMTLAAIGTPLYAADNSAAAPDNSAMNQPDRAGAQPTADQAKNAPSDREIMRNIRRSIVQDKSLSTYAHNVKIIAAQGKVTLKGVVHSEDEKNNIGAKAAAVAGNDNVTNDITVKGS